MQVNEKDFDTLFPSPTFNFIFKLSLSLQPKSKFNSIQFDKYLVNIFNASRTLLAIVGNQDGPRYGDCCGKCTKCFLLKENFRFKASNIDQNCDEI